MSSDESMSEDDVPLASQKSVSARNKPNGNKHTNGRDEDVSMSDEDDVPLSQSTSSRVKPSRSAPRSLKRKAATYKEESSSEDDRPLASSASKAAAVSMPDALEDATAKINGRGTHTDASEAPVPDDSATSEEGDTPKSKGRRPSASRKAKAKRPRKKVKLEDDDDDDEEAIKEEDDGDFDASDDDIPLVKSKGKNKTIGKRVKEESDAEDSDDKPLKAKAALKAKSKRVKKEEVSKFETPVPKKRSAKVKEEDAEEKPKKKGKKKDEEEDEDEIYRWWEAQQNDGDPSEKWQTLEHNGVYFPPPYEPLPSNIKMKYNGKPVTLPPEAEEVAGFYAALLETDHAKDAVFNKNFFTDFKKVLEEHPPISGPAIEKFEPCDFRPMYEYIEAGKAAKKALSAADKKALKKTKDEAEAKYQTCLLDGRKEKVGNFRIEPPGLFRGRGEHPKKGALKLRVRPEEITINIGKGVPIPKPNMPGQWKAVVHDKTVTWLANWQENVNGNYKYVFLAAGSSLKGQSDMNKFEKARELKKHVDRIRADYTVDLKSKIMADRQRATTMYFIDKLALRAGNEKGEDEADTVGCCSLRCEHVTLEKPNLVVFDFLGKDSIRYYNKVPVDPQVFKNIRIFKENKNEDDSLFDRVNTSGLNKHLNSYMKGLTAKVFRTYNASITFQQQLDSGTPENGTVQEKLNAYNHANRMVAILCNHHRTVPKTHENSMEKMKDKVRGLKYDRMKLRHVLFGMDSKYKKDKRYSADESDIDDEWIAEYEDGLLDQQLDKAEKKFAKENEKLVEEGKKPQAKSVLEERKEEIREEYERIKKERGTRKAKLKRERAADKIEEAIQKLDERIATTKLQIDDRDATKEIALNTSKINYLDPRITAAWCKQYDVPVEKIFSKTLLTKFPWAMEVDEDWKF